MKCAALIPIAALLLVGCSEKAMIPKLEPDEAKALFASFCDGPDKIVMRQNSDRFVVVTNHPVCVKETIVSVKPSATLGAVNERSDQD